jgi:tripartite-type tricarboxylate transporter receptor subunit TctC
MASAGNGSVNHVAGELFKMMAGVKLIHVPYCGAGPALADLLGGQVDRFFGGMASTVDHAGAGRLRALAIRDSFTGLMLSVSNKFARCIQVREGCLPFA